MDNLDGGYIFGLVDVDEADRIAHFDHRNLSGGRNLFRGSASLGGREYWRHFLVGQRQLFDGFRRRSFLCGYLGSHRRFLGRADCHMAGDL